MFKEPAVKLSELRKGNCFMFNGQPYIVKRTYWQDLKLLKRKVYVCRMKFEDYDWHTIGDIDIYRISRDLFDILVQSDNNENSQIIK